MSGRDETRRGGKRPTSGKLGGGKPRGERPRVPPPGELSKDSNDVLVSPEGAAGDDARLAKARDPLIIREVAFLGGMAVAGGWRPPVELPEVAFIGRSNVGKSSMLNLLVRRKSFARVSNTPGRTQEVNFFGINGEFILVDLPGYGYAKVSKTKRHSWQPLIDAYLRMTSELRGIALLLDVRREPNEEDLAMLDYLAALGIPTLVVVTKVDKLNARDRRERLAAIKEAAGIEEDQMVACSAHTHEGRDELAAAVAALVSQPAWRRDAAQGAEGDGERAAAGTEDDRSEEDSAREDP